MKQIMLPTTEISNTGESVALSSLSRRDIFNRDEADIFFGSLFFTLFMDENEDDEETDKQYYAYLKNAKNNFSEAYQKGLEKAFNVVQNPNTESRDLSDLVSLFPKQLEIAKIVAQHSNCSDALLARMLHWLPEEAKQNPKLSKPDFQTEEWQQRVNAARPDKAKPKYNDANVLGMFVDSEQPELFKVLYYLEYGKESDRSYILSLNGIPVDLCKDYLGSRGANTRKALANRKTLPEGGFEILAKDKAKTIRLAVASNPAASSEALVLLCEDALQDIAEAAMANPACPEQAIHQTKLKQAQQPTLQETGTEHLKPEEICQLLFDNKTSSAVLEQLARNAAGWVRYACGIHPNAPSQMLEKLATDSEQWVRESVAFNANTPHKILQELAQSNAISMKIALASNPSTSESVQLKLAEFGNNSLLLVLINQTELESVWHKVLETCRTKHDKKVKWQEYLAKVLNPKSKAGPLRTLSRGANSRHLFVQRIIARHPNCPPSLKGQFANYIYSDLVQNPSIALQMLENPQAIDPQPCADWIIKEWGSNATMPGHVSRFFLQGDDSKLARNAIDSWSSLLRDQQRWVLTSDIHVRKRIANKCKLSRFMYEALAHDPKESVRELIAKKKVRSASTSKRLSKDKSTTVRAALAQNKSFKNASTQAEQADVALEVANKGPKRQRIKLAKEATDPNILKQFVEDRAAEVHLAVAQNRHTAAEVLEQLTQQQDEEILKAIAGHENTPSDILVQLSCHANEKIRWTVARHSKLPDVIIRQLLDDPYATVRLRALRQYERYKGGKDTFSDQTILNKMSQDSDESIRRVVAKYTQDIAIQKQYSTDQNDRVRKTLASNLQLDESIAMFLSTDTKTDVIEELAATSRYLPVLIALTHRTEENIPDYIGCNFSQRKQQRIAFAEELLTMEHEGALLSAICIYNSMKMQPDLSVLLQLANHDNPKVRDKLTLLHGYPKPLPKSVIDCLMEKPTQQFADEWIYRLTEKQLLGLIEKGNIEIKRMIASYTDNTVLLLKLAEDTDDLVRENVMGNDYCNAEILEKLNAQTT